MIVFNFSLKTFYLKKVFARDFTKQPDFAFIFDIDGVIVRGKQVLPGVRESFNRLLDSDKKFRIPTVFVTNSGNANAYQRANELTNWLGIGISENQVIMSYSPLSTLTQYHNKRVLISGQGKIQEIATNMGFNNTVTIEEVVNNFPSLDSVDLRKRSSVKGPTDKAFRNIEGVILFNEPTNWETSLQLIVDLLMTNGFPTDIPDVIPYPHIFLIACNMDLLWASDAAMPRFGHGAFLLCLESLYKKITDNELIYTALLGKPSILTYCYANKKIVDHARFIGIERQIKTIYAIGDNINTDVYGANLYHHYLTREATFDGKKFTVQGITDDECRTLAKACKSILVETGVHKSNSNFFVNHSARDFITKYNNLYNPTITAPNVGSAIDIVLREEDFI